MWVRLNNVFEYVFLFHTTDGRSVGRSVGGLFERSRLVVYLFVTVAVDFFFFSVGYGFCAVVSSRFGFAYFFSFIVRRLINDT